MTKTLLNDELTHYGVIGMKWGVRKDPSKQFGKSSTKLNKKKRKLVNRQEEAAKLRYKGTKLESKATSERKLKKARELIFEAAKMDLKNAKLDKKIQKYEQKMKEAFADVSYWKIDDLDMSKGKEYKYMLKDNPATSTNPYTKYAPNWDEDNKYYNPGGYLNGKFFKNDNRVFYERSQKEQDAIDSYYKKKMDDLDRKIKSKDTPESKKKEYVHRSMALEMELQDIHEQDWRYE